MAQPQYIRSRSSDDSKRRTVKRVLIALLALIFFGLGGAWAMGWFSGANRAVMDVQQLQAKLADPNTKDAERRALWREMRQKLDGLSPESQEQVMDGTRERFEKRMNDHIAAVLVMSKADQLKAIDADIDRMQRFEQMRQNRDAAAAAPGGQGQQNGQNRNNRPRTGYRSDSDRITQQKNRLDRSTPQVRAMRSQYRDLIDQRMQQRGIPPSTNRRWG